jgi:hypothetical protein
MGWTYSKTAISSTPLWLHQWRDSLWKSKVGTGTVKIFRWNLNRLHTSLIKNKFNFMPSTFMSSKWTIYFTFYYQKPRMHFSPSPYMTHEPSISSFWILSPQLYSVRCKNHASYFLHFISINFSLLIRQAKFQIHLKKLAKWLALTSHANVHIY